MNNLKVGAPNEKEPLHSWLQGRRRVQGSALRLRSGQEVRDQGTGGRLSNTPSLKRHPSFDILRTCLFRREFFHVLCVLRG
ncbi:MAG TPA: hypothetical protein QF468_10670 [Nitrospinota bacterium]|nr:hypothetical protein [Nitrospinota bacterium]